MNATISRSRAIAFMAVMGLVGVVAGGTIVAAVASLLGSSGNQVIPTAPAAEPGCPDDRVAIEVPDVNGGTRIVTNIPLAASTDETHEFHDCQAFITGPKQYGPRVVIFASEKLALLEETLDISNAPSTAVEETLDTATPSIIALPAAVIYNYGAEYPELSIKKGFSCLVMWKADSDWKAKILPNGYDETVCQGVFDTTAIQGQDLVVEPTAHDKKDPPPSVARWDWAKDKAQQIIGIRCGDEWCEIGPKGFKHSPDREWEHFTGMAGGNELDKELKISNAKGRIRKGRYDEQRLAIMTLPPGATDSVLEPADDPATAIPHPALNKHNDPKHYKGNFKPAAFVILRKHLPAYDSKNWQEGVNKISLCWDSAGSKDCFKKDPTEKPTCQPEVPNGRTWYAETKSSKGEETYGCVKRCERTEWVPGTVRWRWQERDEKLWIRCATGCCTVN